MAAPWSPFLWAAAWFIGTAVSTPIVRRAFEEAHLGMGFDSKQDHLASVEVGSHAVFVRSRSDSVPEKDTCIDDFLPGEVGTDHCLHTNESDVISKEECIVAAQRAAGEVDREHFQISASWETKYPAGCFQWPCKVGGVDHLCYYYNGNANENTASTAGVPICKRAEFIKGTPDSPGGAFGGCSGAYTVIMNETECISVAECLGFARGYPFRIGNSDPVNFTRRKDYPVGCFIHQNVTAEGPGGAGEDEVFFNPGFNEPIEHPVAPKGIPLCRINQTYRVPPQTSYNNGTS